jgi:hypothetical protein
MAEEGIKYILANTPFGSLDAMIEGRSCLTIDLKKIGEIDTSQAAFKEGVREYLEKNFGVVSGQGEKILVSKNNFISAEEGVVEYGNHLAGKSYKVDLEKREIVAVEPLAEIEDDHVREASKLIGASLKKYLEEFFAASNQLMGRFSSTDRSLRKGQENILHFHLQDHECREWIVVLWADTATALGILTGLRTLSRRSSREAWSSLLICSRKAILSSGITKPSRLAVTTRGEN